VTATLSAKWELTTEHSASSYGRPVLVNRKTREAYGPGDLLTPSPSKGYTTAAAFARDLSAKAIMDEELEALLERFK
jgi:hypothetical protein